MKKYCEKSIIIYICISFVAQMRANVIIDDFHIKTKLSSLFIYFERLAGNGTDALESARNNIIQNRKIVTIDGGPIHNILLREYYELTCIIIDSSIISNTYWIRGDDVNSSIKERSSNENKSGIRSVSNDKKAVVLIKAKYVIDCASKADEGQYTCVSSFNGNQTRLASTYIHVEPEITTNNCEKHVPVITEFVTGIFSNIGSDISLHCNTPTNSIITWVGANDTHENLPLTDKHYNIVNGILNIKSIKWDDMGEYTCITTTEDGEGRATTFLYPTVKD